VSALRSFFGRRDEGGQAIVLVAAAMLAMLFAVGLAIDAGQLFVARRGAQEAADAAAFAGAVVLYQGGSAAQAVAAAQADATLNGFTTGGDTTVTVNAPPVSGPFTGSLVHVEVIVQTQVRTALVPAQSSLAAVRARGVAGAQPLNNGYAVMSLDRGDTPNALSVQAGGSVSLNGGGILVNSTSSTAANNQGGSISVEPYPPYGTDVSGNVSGTWPHVSTGQPQLPDPFAGYPKPSTNGLPVYTSLGGTTLNPGVYDVSIAASGGTTLTLNSGVYILRAGMGASGNADIVAGPGGVFLFNANANYPASGGGCTSVSLVGNAVSTLLPLTTGTYANLLFYQDPECTNAFTIAGNGVLTASGTIYVPNGAVVFNGNDATLTGSQLVAKTVEVQNGNVNITFSTATTAQPVVPALAE